MLLFRLIQNGLTRFLLLRRLSLTSLLPRVHAHILHICAAHVLYLKSSGGLAAELELQPRRVDVFGELPFDAHAVCVCSRAGDTIASVNQNLVDGFRHKEIVELIRACGNTVR